MSINLCVSTFDYKIEFNKKKNKIKAGNDILMWKYWSLIERRKKGENINKKMQCCSDTGEQEILVDLLRRSCVDYCE